MNIITILFIINCVIEIAFAIIIYIDFKKKIHKFLPPLTTMNKKRNCNKSAKIPINKKQLELIEK